MEFADLLATTVTHLEGMTPAEWQAELLKLVQRQKAIDALCRGELPADYVYDMLAEHLIDPYAWTAAATENAEALIYGSMG